MQHEFIFTGAFLGFMSLMGNVMLYNLWQQAKEQAMKNPITGLPNWRGLHLLISPIFAMFKRGKALEQITVVAVDLDNFKQVNDRFGHSQGDEVLRTVGEILTGSVRETDVVAHVGGDEFVLVFTNTSSEEVKMVLDRARQRVSSHVFSFCGGAEELGLSFTYGMGNTQVKDLRFEQLYEVADKRCNKNKEREGAAR